MGPERAPFFVFGLIKCQQENTTMWNAIVSLSSNKLVIVIVIMLITIALFLIKKGWFRLSTKSVTIGEHVSRDLLRNQWEYASTSCEAQYAKIRPYCKSDEEAKYLICKVNDIFQSMIVYNNMTENENYVKAKQSLILNAIRKRTSDEHFFTNDFRDCCNSFVELLIKDLVRMKRLG